MIRCMLAVDIVRTTIPPDWQSSDALGAIAVGRGFPGSFLGRDLKAAAKSGETT